MLLTCLGCWSLAGAQELFTVDPGTTDTRPAVIVRGEPTETWHAYFSRIDATSGTVTELVTSVTLQGTTEPLVFSLPEMDEDTYMEVAVSTNTKPRSRDFRWRSIARPKGKKLMDYKGTDKLLPPKDFDDYWKRAKEQLAEVEVNPRVSRVPDQDTTTGLLYRVELDSVERTTVVGWMFVPRDAYKDGDPEKEVVKKYPAIIRTPGYGGDEKARDLTAEGYVSFATNPRNHGPSKAYWKSPVEHSLYNITDPENYYFKLAALDCLQAARFVMGRDEVISDKVGTEGSSQGGYLAIATAMLEPEIACVAADVLAFSDYPDGIALSQRGNHTRMREQLQGEETSVTQIAKSLAYTDGANLVTRLKSPVQIHMGGVDIVCHYICGIVAYNRVPKGVEKKFLIDVSAGHTVSSAMRQASRAWFDQWLKPGEDQKQD